MNLLLRTIWYVAVNNTLFVCLFVFTSAYVTIVGGSILPISCSRWPSSWVIRLTNINKNIAILMTDQSCSLFQIKRTEGNRPRGFRSSLLIWKWGHDCSSKDVLTAPICSCAKLCTFTLWWCFHCQPLRSDCRADHKYKYYVAYGFPTPHHSHYHGNSRWPARFALLF
jgi:hypothetical protein